MDRLLEDRFELEDLLRILLVDLVFAQVNI